MPDGKQNLFRIMGVFRLLSAVLVLALSARAINAQDIIVKTDGTAIPAKVTKVTETEIEFRKHANPDGPTYALPVADVIAVNYENGTKDTFQAPASVSPATGAMQAAPNQQLSDFELLALYKDTDYNKYMRRSKAFKITAWAGFAAFAIPAIYMCAATDMSWDQNWIPAASLGGLAVVWGGGFLYASYAMKHKAESCLNMTSIAFMEQELFSRDGISLSASLNIIRNNYTKDNVPGIGCRLIF